ncbi:MAG: hypothetical protein ACTS22_01205 [Phycisphaerales bacterium]
MRRRAAVFACVLAAGFSGLSGCAARNSLESDDGDRAAPLPTYEALYEGAERRIGTLDRLWAVAVVGLRYTDESGERRRDQGEGHFQMVRPSQLALFVGKLGEPYLILGSNESRYWWIERLDEPVATVGLHAEAAGMSTEAIGVPVMPSDLLLAMDVQRWPAPGGPGVAGVSWSDRDGVDRSRTAAVELIEGDRRRVVHVDVFTMDPVAVDVQTLAGDLIATSELSEPDRVTNRIGAAVEPRMPMRVVVDVPAAEARIELYLKRAEMSERRPRSIVFDLEELLDRFRVQRVRRIQSPSAAMGAGA